MVFLRDEDPVPVRRPAGADPAPEPGDARDALPRARLEGALQALLEGPSPEEVEAGLVSMLPSIPPDAEPPDADPPASQPRVLLAAVEVREGLATVSLSGLREAAPNASSSAGSRALLLQLNGTAFAVEGVERVRWELDGSCEAFWAFLQRSCQVVERDDARSVP
ncbi:MAG: hypothetical protein EA352_08065 [Gemmatimonadales bacterium]|nr:MAG: hypothetical protein EA352_08065 [Gemmatimonadales bacterium]